MEIFDTFRPIPIICDYCSKEFSSSTIIYHQKKYHNDLPPKYTPNKIQCQKCLKTVLISSIYFHNSNCEQKPNKIALLAIAEENQIKSSCRYCKRIFSSNRLDKHQSVCESASKKRPIFDILKKRTPYLEDTSSKLKAKRSSVNLKYPNSKWQKQHLQLLKNLRVESEDTSYEDYVFCPHCTRRFAPISAEKHIEICKNLFNRPRPPPSALSRVLPSLSKQQSNFKAYSLKNLKRPFSVMKLGQGLSASIDEGSSVETSPGRLLKQNRSIRESRSLSSSKNIKRVVLDGNRLVNKTTKNIERVEKKDQKRSMSSQKIGNVVKCHSCRSVITFTAKFCSTCGAIRVSGY